VLENVELARGVEDVDVLDVLVDVIELLGVDVLLGLGEVVETTVVGVTVEED
jgi:hypothetical protein